MLTIACLAAFALGPIEIDAKPSVERLSALVQYHQRRDDLGTTAKDHFALAEWCEKNGLPAEAMAHYTVATRINPNFAEAWTRMGYRRFEGQWRSEAQIARITSDRKDRAEAEARYKPWLLSWSDWLRKGGKMDEAVKVLDTVIDPHAVPSIRQVFGGRHSVNQALAVRMLDRIDANDATLGLCMLAVDGVTPKTRDNASLALENRDPQAYVGYLINRIREPIKYEVREGDGIETAGELWVEEPARIVDKVYDLPEALPVPRPRTEIETRLDSSGLWRRYSVELRFAPGSTPSEDFAAARRRLSRDLLLLERENYAIERANDRVLPVLRQATGQGFGTDRQAWSTWWTNQLGYNYQSRPVPTEPKPVVVQHIQTVAPQPVLVQAIATPLVLSRSCFAAGTLVRTETGLRPIESLEVGDLVLARNTTTGAFSYRPIVATFHNPPAATLRVETDDDAIIATGIHRFWRVGVGWTMARDLKPGDRLGLFRGEGRVAAIRSEEVQPVFNLEVLDDANFFVGSRGALVHDNTLVLPIARPFDAVQRR